ncbi:MAG: hypothetical protein ACMG6E_06695 [Candidatus Roizmanbacteria bacterium]
MKTYNGVKESRYQPNDMMGRDDLEEDIVEEPIRRTHTYQVVDANNIHAI